jgi:tetratricopeptide (TPR) repeat protein
MKQLFILLFPVVFIICPLGVSAQNVSDPFIVADSLYKMKDFNGAIEKYTVFINNNHSNKAALAVALDKRAIAKFKLKLYKEVIDDENEALEADSSFRSSYWTRASAYSNMGDSKMRSGIIQKPFFYMKIAPKVYPHYYTSEVGYIIR